MASSSTGIRKIVPRYVSSAFLARSNHPYFALLPSRSHHQLICEHNILSNKYGIAHRRTVLATPLEVASDPRSFRET